MSLQKKKLLIAMELSNKKWKLCFSDGTSRRERTIPARSESDFWREVDRAREKLALRADTPVVSCYEAGRDGFWIDRMLAAGGVCNHVIDPSSIEVPRRARQRKTDRLDVHKLMKLLVHYELFDERDSFARVCVPSEEEEAQLRTHRERERLTKERTGHRARIRSLCVLHGIELGSLRTLDVDALRDYRGRPLQEAWRTELRREFDRLALVEEQLKQVEDRQTQELGQPRTRAAVCSSKLCRLKSIGLQSSWVLSHECFGWRQFANRKKLGSFGGLTGTPYDSGDSVQDQGISKAGNRRVRTTMIELAWMWVRWQPDSELTRWFHERYSDTKRSRRKGIVALARKLLIALWKYVEQDVVPAGAVFKNA